MYVFLRCVCGFFFFKQKTAYEMRISDWSSDVCSSDLDGLPRLGARRPAPGGGRNERAAAPDGGDAAFRPVQPWPPDLRRAEARRHRAAVRPAVRPPRRRRGLSDRKSVVSGKSVSVRVDLGGRRIIKNKKLYKSHQLN